jgi:hypothetical protein
VYIRDINKKIKIMRETDYYKEYWIELSHIKISDYYGFWSEMERESKKETERKLELERIKNKRKKIANIIKNL